VVSGIDAQELLADPPQRVAGDVEREQSRRADAAAMAEPHERRRQPQIPGELVEERRVKGGELLVAGWSVRRRDLKRPREIRRTAEELLVEVVADSSDRLRNQERRRRGVQEARDVGAAATQYPHAGEGARGDPAPDAKATVPHGERPPPVVGNLAPAGATK
jgi:hypothetical protein